MCYFIWFSFKIYFSGGNNLKLKVSRYWYNNLDPDPKKTGRNFNFDFCVAACWPRRLWQPPGKPSPWAPSGQPPWTRFQVLIFNRHTSTGRYLLYCFVLTFLLSDVVFHGSIFFSPGICAPSVSHPYSINFGSGSGIQPKISFWILAIFLSLSENKI